MYVVIYTVLMKSSHKYGLVFNMEALVHFRGNHPPNVNYTKTEEQRKQLNSPAGTTDKYALGCLMVGEESSCNSRTKQLTENSNHRLCVCVSIIY